MRSGKSFFASQLLQGFCSKGGFGLIYNTGKPQDWKGAEPFDFVTATKQRAAAKQQKKEWDGSLVWCRPTKGGGYMHIAGLPVNRAGRAVKTVRYDEVTDRLLAESFYKWLGKSLIIYDDCRELFRHGIPAEFLGLLSKINHVGSQSPFPNLRGMGADVVLIFHGIDQVNPELWTYATDIVQFRTPPTETPSYKSVDNAQVRAILSENTAWLEQAPKYSKTIYSPHTGQIHKIQHNGR